MQFYRCKCGSLQSWTSMGVPQCSSCAKCGSDLAQGADLHREPKAHDMSHMRTIAVDGGAATITRCKYCHLTQAEIDAEAAQFLTGYGPSWLRTDQDGEG